MSGKTKYLQNFLVNGDLNEELCGDCRTDLFAKVIGNVYENPDILKGGEQ